MSEMFEINADIRADVGKGASRRLRRAGRVPAVLYGGGREPVSLTLQHSEVMRHLDYEAFYSHVLTIRAGEKSQNAILRDVQRHPFKPTVLHLDFLRVMADTAIRVHAPLHFINESTSLGVKAGGVVLHNANDVEIECLPKDLPEYVEVDLAAMQMGETVFLSDLKLPEGVKLTAFLHGDEEAHDQPVASIQAPRAEIEEGEEGEVGEEDEDVEAGPEED
jgi:large subunit ribosomal protein L25